MKVRDGSFGSPKVISRNKITIAPDYNELREC